MAINPSDINSFSDQLTELRSTLKQLQHQLKESSSNDSCELISLQSDLIELIQLKEDELLEAKKSILLSQVADQLKSVSTSSDEQSIPLHSGDSVEPVQGNIHPMKDFLEQNLIGQRCSVNGWTSEGIFLKQNAVIAGVIDSRHEANPESSCDSLTDRVRVFLVHPTRHSDIPCPTFVDNGLCPRAIRCTFSHGNVVSVKDLGEWQEPDMNGYLQEGRACLVRRKTYGHQQRGSLWKHAHLLHTDFDSATCVVEWGVRPTSQETTVSKNPAVTFAKRQKSYDDLESLVANVPMDWVYLLPEDTDQQPIDTLDVSDHEDSTLSSDDASSSADELDYPPVLDDRTVCHDSQHPPVGFGKRRVAFVPGGQLLPGETLQLNSSVSFETVHASESNAEVNRIGAWEAHTRGVGSRILSAMGYRGSGGLGVTGQGRQLPVALLLDGFQIIPRGWNKRPSLDRVVSRHRGPHHSRQNRNVKSTVVSRSASKPNIVAESKQQTVFDLINKALCSKQIDNNRPSKSMTRVVDDAHHAHSPSSSSSLAKKNSNAHFFRLQENINNVLKQIKSTKQSLERNHGRDRVMAKQAEQRLQSLYARLSELRSMEQSHEKAKAKETGEKKLRIF